MGNIPDSRGICEYSVPDVCDENVVAKVWAKLLNRKGIEDRVEGSRMKNGAKWSPAVAALKPQVDNVVLSYSKWNAIIVTQMACITVQMATK